MGNFSAETLSHFTAMGEDEFATTFPCIVKRVGLDIVSGTGTYTLADEVFSIRRLTWRGLRVDPLRNEASRKLFQGVTQVEKPLWYIFDNVGRAKIQFFPTPNETIAASSGLGMWGASIRTSVIVEYYSLPDYVDNVIPEIFRRRLLKYFTMWKCYELESNAQSLKKSEFNKMKWKAMSQYYGSLLFELHNKPRRLICQQTTPTVGRYIAPPILNISKFGFGVED